MTRSSPAATADGDSIAAAILNALNHSDRQLRAEVIEEASRAADPDVLVRAVGDHADAIRRNAAMEALVRGGRRSVPALVRALDDRDPEVVMFAAGLLGRTRDREAIPHLLRLLSYEDVNIVQAAVESLGYLRATAAVAPLVDLLERDPWVRLGAIHALGEIGDARAVDPLGSALSDLDAWDFAVAALGKLRSVRAIEHLAGALWNSVDRPEFEIALRALADALHRQPSPEPLRSLEAWSRLASSDARRLHDRLGALLDGIVGDGTGEQGELAVAAAVMVRMLRLRSAYPALIRCGRSNALRFSVQFCTLALGPEVEGALAGGLADPDPEVRVFACRCAGALRLRSLTPSLIERLADPHDGVRHGAVHALARVGTVEAVAPIADCLLDESPEVRSAAQVALGVVDPSAASEALLTFPRREPAVVAAMLRVMRSSPHPDQLPFVLDCLRSDDADVRKLAVDALAEQPEIDVTELLEPVLHDEALEVRAAAIRALGRRRTARARELLVGRLVDDAPSVPLIVEMLVAMEGAGIGARLLQQCQAATGTARLSLLQALSELREPAAAPLATELLADADPEVRRAAVRAIARFRTDVAERYVLAAATDPAWQVRATVAEVLGDLAHAGARDELERLCLDEHPFVATTARHRLEALHDA